jgi:hypothetical protein
MFFEIFRVSSSTVFEIVKVSYQMVKYQSLITVIHEDNQPKAPPFS